MTDEYAIAAWEREAEAVLVSGGRVWMSHSMAHVPRADGAAEEDLEKRESMGRQPARGMVVHVISRRGTCPAG